MANSAFHFPLLQCEVLLSFPPIFPWYNEKCPCLLEGHSFIGTGMKIESMFFCLDIFLSQVAVRIYRHISTFWARSWLLFCVQGQKAYRLVKLGLLFWNKHKTKTLMVMERSVFTVICYSTGYSIAVSLRVGIQPHSSCLICVLRKTGPPRSGLFIVCLLKHKTAV